MVVTADRTGKTTLCRSFLPVWTIPWPQRSFSIPLFPILSSSRRSTRSLASGWGKAGDEEAVSRRLNAFLMQNFAKGKNTVLLIDEAQNLPHSVMEQIRMLSNLETVREKLIQIILLGQPELLRLLALPSLRQLNERITVRYDLKPLARKDVHHYIEHRIARAGGQAETIFAPGSYGRIYRASRGIPRRINAICDRALLIAYGKDLRTVDRRLIQAAIRDIGPGYLTDMAPAGMSLIVIGIVVFILAAVLLWAGHRYLAGGFRWPLF